MGVGVCRVVLVHREVRDHALRHKVRFQVIPHERDVLIMGELDGEPDLKLARELRILAALFRLDRIPKGLAIGELSRRPPR